MGESGVIMELSERLEKYLGEEPRVDGTAFIAKSAELIGDVRIGAKASIWPKCVLRGDINFIEIGEGSNLQDGTLVHLSDDYPVKVGKYVTVGHGAMLHACEVGDECLVGMRTTILDGAVIGERSVIGANALVSKGMMVPAGSLVLGVPGKVSRVLSEEEQKGLGYWARKYIELAKVHRARGT